MHEFVSASKVRTRNARISCPDCCFGHDSRISCPDCADSGHAIRAFRVRTVLRTRNPRISCPDCASGHEIRAFRVRSCASDTIRAFRVRTVLRTRNPRISCPEHSASDTQSAHFVAEAQSGHEMRGSCPELCFGHKIRAFRVRGSSRPDTKSVHFVSECTVRTRFAHFVS